MLTQESFRNRPVTWEGLAVSGIKDWLGSHLPNPPIPTSQEPPAQAHSSRAPIRDRNARDRRLSRQFQIHQSRSLGKAGRGHDQRRSQGPVGREREELPVCYFERRSAAWC